MTKKSKPKRRKAQMTLSPKQARLTLTLENYAGIKKQVWQGIPQDLSINWPVDASMSFLGSLAPYVIEPNQVEINVVLPYRGMSYLANPNP